MQVGITRTSDINVSDSLFSFVERKMIETSHNREVIEELSKLKTGLKCCENILQTPDTQSEISLTTNLFESSKDIMHLFLMDNAVEADFKATLNAALIFNANFPIKVPNNTKSLKQVFRYTNPKSGQPDDICLAEEILPNALDSKQFIPVLACSDYQDWVCVMPNFDFDVKHEFNLIRLMYILQRDVFTAYKDELFRSNSSFFIKDAPERLNQLIVNCYLLFSDLEDEKSIEYGLRKMTRKGNIPQIKSNHLVGLMREMIQRLLSLNVGYDAIREINAHEFNRVLADAEMRFLPTCLYLLDPVVGIKEYESLMKYDMERFRELSENGSDLYAFKVNKLESALIALNRLHMFRETLLRPCEIKPFGLAHELEAKVEHTQTQVTQMELQLAVKSQKHKAELKKRDGKIKKLETQVRELEIQAQKRDLEFELMQKQLAQLMEKVDFNK